MFAKLRDWLDNRTGYRKLISALLIEHIPGGARWRYVWGSCLAFVFGVQLITGLLLMTAYSPGESTAWSSVYYIQYEMDFGWLIRGLHHFGSQTMVVLLGLHMLQVVIAGAHLPPREVNWWLGLALLGAVLALSLTGYLLPWDQKGYWATQVATGIAGNLPLIGPWVQKVVVGGPAYGHHTLTRFYTLHVGILPAVVIVLTALHLTVFRRHGVTTPPGSEKEEGGWFWPDQAFKDLLISLVIFGGVLALVVVGWGHKVEAPADAESPGLYERWAHAGKDGRGANLDAPADPAEPYPARPEWYFLFLFQLLKYFPGEQEIIGTVIIPNAVLVLLALLPLLGFGRMRRFGHIFGVLVVTGLLVGAAALTCLALADDMTDPVKRWLVRGTATALLPTAGGALLLMVGALALLPRGGTFRKVVWVVGSVVLLGLLGGAGSLLYGAVFDRLHPEVTKWVDDDQALEGEDELGSARKFDDELKKAEKAAARAITLAGKGVPAGGAINLLRHDPRTQGERLFGQYCASCHNHSTAKIDNPGAMASDLAGFGTEEYTLRLLTAPGHDNFFGRTARTTMQDFIFEKFPNVALPPAEVAKLPKEEQIALEKDRGDLATIARWLARHPRRTSPDRNDPEFVKGQKLFRARLCQGCHSYEENRATRSNRGPDLTGYGDAEWVRMMIMAPAHEHRYGVNRAGVNNSNTMPAFLDLEGPAGPIARAMHNEMKERHLEKIGEEDKRGPRLRKNIEAGFRVVHLGDIERELIIRWLLRDDRVVFGGEPVAP